MMEIKKNKDKTFTFLANGKPIKGMCNIKFHEMVSYLTPVKHYNSKYQKLQKACEFYGVEFDTEALSKKFKEMTLDVKPDEKEEIPLFDDWEALEEDIREVFGEESLKIFKRMAATVLSLRYINTASVYLILYANPGAGKSTLCSLFEKSDLTFHTDDWTAAAWAAGTVTEEQESYSLLDFAKNKTLISHDVTPAFRNVHAFDAMKKSLENIFGRKNGYGKFSPGSGNRHYGESLNAIIGVNPQTFWKKRENRAIGLELIETDRYIYSALPRRDQGEDFIKGRIITRDDIDRISLNVAGYLKFIHERGKRKHDINEDMRRRIVEVIEESNRKTSATFNSKEGMLNYIERAKDTIGRRTQQCVMYIKGMADLHDSSIEDWMIKDYGECLNLPVKTKINESELEDFVDCLGN